MEGGLEGGVGLGGGRFGGDVWRVIREVGGVGVVVVVGDGIWEVVRLDGNCGYLGGGGGWGFWWGCNIGEGVL